MGKCVCTDGDKKVGLGWMEQDKLDRAFDLLEWGLGMLARNLVDPYSTLPPSTGYGNDQR
jgi:hypothetical protein